MAQERSTSANSRENDSPRSTERHRRSTIHQLSISENDTSSGSSDQSNDNVPAEDETSPKSKRLKSRARSQLSSSSVSGWHDSLEALNSNSEDEDPETPLPSRLSTPTNDSGSETIQTSGNVPQAQQTDKNATQVIDLCTPEPEITPPESIPKSNRVLKLSRSPSFGSRDPIKRERSPSTLLNTPRRRRLFKSWESYNEDIARNYKPSGPKFKACARCQSKSMICDGRERCQRCIQKNATCIYNEKGTEPCLACQKRKSKCDKEFPCNRCVARHEKCIYEHEPPKFEESGSKQVIKAEEKTSDHVPSMGIPPPCPEISQDPKKLKRPASGWMNRYREKTEPVQSATRTKERYPRPPKPLRAKKPLRNARDQRGKQIMSRNFPERDEYGLFETRASRTPTKVEITDASWMRLDRGEILQLGNSAPSLELNFNKFLESGTPDSRQWASLPSPISFGGGLKEKTVSQESVGRSSEILKSTAERKRPSFLKPLQKMAYIVLGPNVFAVYQEFLEFYCPVLANALPNAVDRAATPKLLADVDNDVFGLFVQWLYTQSLLNKNSQPAYQHRSMALWVLAKRLQMPALQNDCLDVLEERRRMEGTIQTKTFAYVYANTAKGDPLRLYLVDVCCCLMETFQSQEVEELFPEEMRQEIAEAAAVKSEDADGGIEIETTQYRVPVDII